MSHNKAEIEKSLKKDDRLCRGCKGTIATDVVQCKRCGTFYHPGCINQGKNLPQGVFTKCCGPRAKSPTPISKEEWEEMLTNKIDFCLTKHNDELKKQLKVDFSDCLQELKDDLMKNLNRVDDKPEGTKKDVKAIKDRLDIVETVVNELKEISNENLLSDDQVLSESTAVRYGRVPKRSRERGSDDVVGATTITTSTIISTTTTTTTTRAHQLTSCVNNNTSNNNNNNSSSSSRSSSSSSSSSSSNNNNIQCQNTISRVQPPPTVVEADQSDTEGKQLAIYDVILQVSQAHHAHCGFTEESTRDLVQKPIIIPASSPEDPEVASSTAETVESQRIWLWQQFATRITPWVQRIVEFAKRVPGFCDLPQDDQLILIKVGFFEVWLSHISKMTTSNSMTFEDGTYITKHQLELMYEPDFVSAVMQFTESLNAHQLTDAELGLFSGAILLSERPGLNDFKAVQKLQEQLLEALNVNVTRNNLNSNETTSSKVSKDSIGVSQRIPELRALGAQHENLLDWFRRNWTKLKLPPLFAEIFDIPKCEEDLQ